MGVCLGVYAVGAYVILKWACQRLLVGYWRLTLRRYGGIPVPVLEDWEEDMHDDWRR